MDEKDFERMMGKLANNLESGNYKILDLDSYVPDQEGSEEQVSSSSEEQK
jgi:hypothetical protein